jgi:predicted esterase
MLPYHPEHPPILAGTEVLIDAGASDPYSSPEQTRRLADILRNGVVTAHTEPRAGHNLTRNDLSQTARWLAVVTGGGN